MAIKVAIQHHTAYRFDRLTSILPHVIRLRPAPHSKMPIHAYSLQVTPKNHFINWQQDPFANYLARLVFPEPARELVLDVEVIVDMTVINPFDFFLEESVENYPFKYDRQLRRDLAPYLQIAERGPLLTQLLARVDRSRQPMIGFLVAVNQLVQQAVAYLVRMDPGVQTCEQTLALRSGSCRDSAWLLVQVLRHLGLAARFVSGYLVQLTPDQKPLEGPAGPEHDFTDLHAWGEVFIPGAGWVGLDPTSGLFAGEGHIPLACTPEPQSAAPVTGTTGVCQVEFAYSNTVTRLVEDPRVTKPYDAEQWQAIDALGLQVDKALNKGKVQLTMGGEPTFVSIDDMESAQWNTEALGDDKLKLASELLLRLKQDFAPGSLLHHGQGKWYPDEPLPRWALGIYWRRDGTALWPDATLLDTQTTPGKAKPVHALRFAKALCAELQLDPRYLVTGYEDQDYYLQREGKLPSDVTVRNSQLEDEQERARLRRVFDQGLTTKIGYALPLAWSGSAKSGGWRSSRWQFRRNRMFLTPGDSPMGLRLPLDSLPWRIPRDYDFELDPFNELGPLQTPEPIPAKDGAKRRARMEKIIHTALCVQVRDGHLHIFMPPLHRLEYYVQLCQAIATAASALRQPVIIEGYEPPRDPRLRKLLITPDPGVIEVNIHPAANWRELSTTVSTLYASARECRLATEKFMLDGKHTGTGGGNHVTMGAARAEQSPFLRRPDLLGSLLRYWQNHPALSYLFSGQFIGPTSQAPRVDEARDDNLYELEIALQQLPRSASDKPWVVDRILRNLLVDLTGNTHRSEFCIDKLYSPQASARRLGLVEFRNFEMPPHWQMSMVQLLLLRALVARFWNEPYKRPLIRWGGQLRDRFMLPHYIEQDWRQVVQDINEAGFAFAPQWLLPFQEFRFPHYGHYDIAGLQLDLHGAIEPWHVLGEETSGTGTSRYVDSSVERLQVRVRGVLGNHLALYCNGRRVPLQNTGRDDEFVAGIRYKAWAPWSALHPTIDVHTPLTFDVVDLTQRRSLGGCRYHVGHPGGRNYDTFPVNANEAEARRTARFTVQGHRQGHLQLRDDPTHDLFPCTLDLRYGDLPHT